MFRCEHGKDSDICVLCWEEKNLEPDTMKTKLQLAIEEARSFEAGETMGYFQELIEAAEKLELAQGAVIDRENMIKELCDERDALKLALNKVCAYLRFKPSEGSKERHEAYNNAVNEPLVVAAIKETK